MADAKIIHEDGSEEIVGPRGPQPVWGYGADYARHIVAEPPQTEDSVGLCGKPAGWTAAFVTSYGGDPAARPVCEKCQERWDADHPAS
jgi:hypothetical protein